MPPAGESEELRSREWSQDQVWFTPSEARALLPQDLSMEETGLVPDRLARRLAQLHVLDDVRGAAEPFSDDQVELAEWRARLVSVIRNEVRVEWEGRTLAVAEPDPGAGRVENGLETSLFGRGTFDRSRGRFVEFRLLAKGERWGRGPNNGRAGQEAPSPIGFAFELTPPTHLFKVAPKFFGRHFSANRRR
ncbi:MAG: hypothetical protein V2A76_10230 [Planctomycetota bacterium]